MIEGLKFENILSHLVALYRQSLLVPFIGSGMSLPACTNWLAFLKKLAGEARINVVHNLDVANASVLYRVADNAVSALRPLPFEERVKKYRSALLACELKDSSSIPLQTQALAKLYWPLVLTTNYDDLYWSTTSLSTRPSILGRSREDCHLVLRSLDETTPPVLWALQGFLGGQVEKELEKVIPDSLKRYELANQLVVGHQQYQRAINAEGHFRRAFAEVFRRRSLLFLGSGLLEDYLINLFSEILHNQGSGPYPHFALLNIRDRERFDSSFLQTRLGIVPVFYENYNQLPEYLNQLSKLIEFWPTITDDKVQLHASGMHFNEFGFTLNPVTNPSASFKVNICKSPLPLPNSTQKECAVVSVGRWENTPLEGRQAEGFLKKAKEAGFFAASSEAKWIGIDQNPSYVFRYSDTPIFAVAARRRDSSGDRHDARDLGIIPEAICTALEKIDEKGFELVHLGPIASGKWAQTTLWHSIHPFAQMLRGIKEFISTRKIVNLKRINIYVVDPSVWYPIVAGKVPVAELLSSDITTHRVEIRDAEKNTESFSVTLKESPTLKDLLKLCNINDEYWEANIFPRPTDDKTNEHIKADTVVTPTMTVVLSPRK